MENEKTNVGQSERLISTITGGALVLSSLGRLSLGRLATGGALLYRGISGHSYLYDILNINTDSQNRQIAGPHADDKPEVERAITIEKPAEFLYQLWQDPENLSKIMGNFATVTGTGEGRFHWTVQGPQGRQIEWDTQTVEERPNELIHWQSVEGAFIPNEGSVRFRPAPGDRGTEVNLHMRFDPPGGVLSSLAMKKMGFIPSLITGKILYRFKSLADTGEIATLEKNPSARATTQARVKAYVH